MKKIMIALASTLLLCGLIVVAKPVTTYAAAPCSIDTINAANAQIAQAQLAYANAQQTEAAALAALNAANISGSQLEKAVAANAYTTAQNQTHWALDQLNNAKAFLANITARANGETAIEQNIAQLKNLSNMQSVKQDADNAVAIANGTLAQINQVKLAIAAYQQQLAATPSVQAQINALNVQLKALEADYAAKKAVADQKTALLASVVAADQYDAYAKAVIDDSVDRLYRRGEYAIPCPVCGMKNCPCEVCNWDCVNLDQK